MTEFQQFIVIRHGESQTNATNTFQAGNQYGFFCSVHPSMRGTLVVR